MARSPRPPPPRAPAMAEAPIREIMASVTPRTMECRASGISTFQMIWKGEAPTDWAASMTPGSTSSSEDSMIRAIYGAAEIVSGTMAAVVPMEVPTMIRVSGMMATIRMMKGVERTALTMAPRIWLMPVFSRIWPGLVTVRMMPRGKPISVARTAAIMTM